MKADLKIEIRPIPDRDGIKGFSKNLQYFSRAHIIAPFVNPVTRKFVTGLTEEDKEYLKKEGFPYNIDDTYHQDVAHEFWESSIIKVELTSSPVFLYPGKNLIDFVKYKYLLLNNYIYSSEEELKNGGKADATHYIFDEGTENKLKASILDKKNSLVAKVTKLSLTRKRQIIMILLNENTDNKNEDYLTVRFDDILKDKEKVFELEKLIDGESEEVALKAEIKSAIQKNILRRTKKGIFYFETNLGFGENDVVETLKSPEYQEILLKIKTQL